MINKEIKYSEEFKFEEIKDGLVKLNLRNVALSEAMLINDSTYIKGSSEKSCPVIKIDKKTGLEKVVYGGSTAYWVNELKKVLIDNVVIYDEDYYKLIGGLVSAIDRENNTHLNSDGVGRKTLTDRISTYTKYELLECLKDVEKGCELIKRLTKLTNPYDSNKKGRENYSFATKFCHFVCYYLFDDENKDNYSIYDSVVHRAIKKYITYYKIDIKGKSISDYRDFLSIIDEIRENAYKETGCLISRNGLDHLLWFYYRGR